MLDHLAELPSRIPRGTRQAPVRSADTIRAAGEAIARAIRGGWGIHEGGAVELLDRLRSAGFLLLLRTPCPQTAGMAMAALARLTPLVEEIRRGRYTIHAGRPADLEPRILKQLERGLRDVASRSTPVDETLSYVGRIDASASGADPGSQTALHPGNRERARGDTSSPRWLSDGEQLGLALVFPGAVARSSSDPADPAGARPARSPARSALEPKVTRQWTRLAWIEAVPLRPQLQRAARLALGHLSEIGLAGTAGTVALQLASHEDRLTARSRASLARALCSLRDRGLLIEEGGRWRLPEFVAHPILELFELDERPSARAPSPAMSADLTRQGVDPAGLTHEEAVQVQRRLFSRRRDGRPHPRMLARILAERDPAGRRSDLRQLGRLDIPAARRELAEAMADRCWWETTERLHA